MNKAMTLCHRRAARTAGRMLPGVRADVAPAYAAVCALRQQGARLDDASGAALEVGLVEHWDSIEHIEYGNYVNEFDIGGGNAFGPGSAYDWTGEQR